MKGRVSETINIGEVLVFSEFSDSGRFMGGGVVNSGVMVRVGGRGTGISPDSSTWVIHPERRAKTTIMNAPATGSLADLMDAINDSSE